MKEWGIFNDDAPDWTVDESCEADFYSKEEAEKAIRDRYPDPEGLVVHEIEAATCSLCAEEIDENEECPCI